MRVTGTLLLLIFSTWISASVVFATSAAFAEGREALQVDDFEDGTTMGWRSGGANPNPPAWEPSGGPSGPSDGYLRIEGNGSGGAGGNLVAFNTNQWARDYSQTDVAGIQAQLRNFGESDLVIRLLFEGDHGDLVTSSAARVPRGAGWQTFVWPISPFDPVFSAVTKLRIVHASTVEGLEPVVGVLGVDNVTALSGDLCRDAGFERSVAAHCRVYCEKLDCEGQPRNPRTCDAFKSRFERHTGDFPPCARDRDADGWTDDLDNCPDEVNVDQADTDGDGVGDACDVCPNDPNPGQDPSICECPCFSGAEVAELISTLSDPDEYENLACIDDRPDVKPLTFISAFRRDGLPCGSASQDCSVLAAEFTEDNTCQYNPPEPAEQVLFGEISVVARENCRALILEEAEAANLSCD